MPTKPFEGLEPERQLNTIELGYTLQRLFSTFPDGWPGGGLLLLRLCLSIALLYLGVDGLSNPSEMVVFGQHSIAAVGGIFLLAGLWTPVVGALVALDELWIAFSSDSPPREDPWVHIFLAILALSVAMLGPGAWSIDARLFGRKRFDVDRSRGRKPSL